MKESMTKEHAAVPASVLSAALNVHAMSAMSAPVTVPSVPASLWRPYLGRSVRVRVMSDTHVGSRHCKDVPDYLKRLLGVLQDTIDQKVRAFACPCDCVRANSLFCVSDGPACVEWRHHRNLASGK